MACTILLVEDDELTAAVESRMLERHGYRVVKVEEGVQAIATVEREPAIELVLMDIELKGGMDGAEAARSILQVREIPVVFLTRHTDEDFVRRIEGVPGYGFVLKNTGEAVLIESVRMAQRLFDATHLIRRREREYRELIETVREGIWRVDEEGYTTYVNEAMSNMLGYDRGSMLGGHLLDCIDETSGETARRILGQRGGGISEQYDLTFRCRDGTQLDALVGVTPLKEENGTRRGVLAAVMDITERKRGERKRDEDRRFIRDVHALADIGMWRWDYATDTVYWTEELYRIAGRDPAEPPPTYAEQPGLYAAESWERLQQAVNEALESGRRYELELELLRPDGEIRNVMVIGGPHYDASGSIDELYGTIHDITAYRRAEARREESNRRFQTLLESITDSVFVVDHSFRYAMVNEAACRLAGRRREEMLGESIFEIFPGFDETEFFPAFREAIHSRAQRTLEGSYPAGGDEERWYEISLYPIEEGLLCISRDVTERKQDAARLKQALADKDQLMRELNHRVKNNLFMISSLISLKESTTDRPEEYSDIRSQIDAIRIVHDKLHKTSGVRRINFAEYAEELLDTVFSHFVEGQVRVENRIEQGSLPTETAIPLGLLINEVATNAIKYGFRTGEEARFTVELRRDDSSGWYTLVLSNSGNPFPEEKGLDAPETLGLRLIASLSEQLGGSVELVKRPQPVFTVTFPGE